MLISLSGRKGSGKSLLANELTSRGFTRIGFADYLKELISQLYNWNIEDLYDPIKKEEPFPSKWNQSIADKLAEIIKKDVPYNGEIDFKTRRDTLTFIGNETLRTIDPDFHVNSLFNKIDPNKDYVIDDMRYPNELNKFKQFSGLPIFVFRPYNFVYSNHPSEVSLTRSKFEHVLVNDSSKEELVNKMNAAICGHSIVNKFCYESEPPFKISLLKKLPITLKTENEEMALELSDYLNSFREGCEVIVTSPYVIEDMKIWKGIDLCSLIE